MTQDRETANLTASEIMERKPQPMPPSKAELDFWHNALDRMIEIVRKLEPRR